MLSVGAPSNTHKVERHVCYRDAASASLSLAISFSSARICATKTNAANKDGARGVGHSGYHGNHPANHSAFSRWIYLPISRRGTHLADIKHQTDQVRRLVTLYQPNDWDDFHSNKKNQEMFDNRMMLIDGTMNISSGSMPKQSFREFTYSTQLMFDY